MLLCTALERASPRISLWRIAQWYKAPFSSPPRGNSLREPAWGPGQAQLSTANFLCVTLKSSQPSAERASPGAPWAQAAASTTMVDLLTFVKHLRTGGSKIRTISSTNHQIYTAKNRETKKRHPAAALPAGKLGLDFTWHHQQSPASTD